VEYQAPSFALEDDLSRVVRYEAHSTPTVPWIEGLRKKQHIEIDYARRWHDDLYNEPAVDIEPWCAMATRKWIDSTRSVTRYRSDRTNDGMLRSQLESDHFCDSSVGF
jgi:hypothetical protein